MKKKILLLGAFCLFGLVGCGKKDNVEDWQDAQEFGTIDDSVQMDELYKWGEVSEDLYIDKLVNLKESNTYKTLTYGIFTVLWNTYADEKYNYEFMHEKQENKIKVYNILLNDDTVEITIKEKNDRIISASIVLNDSLSEEERYKYTTISYYILSPHMSKTKLNEDIVSLKDGEEKEIRVSSSVKNLTIRNSTNSNGIKTVISYNYKGEQQ